MKKEKVQAKYNEFGTCIDCQNGFEGCLHNNLVETAGETLCTVCGKCMSCGSV